MNRHGGRLPIFSAHLVVGRACLRFCLIPGRRLSSEMVRRFGPGNQVKASFFARMPVIRLMFRLLATARHPP